MNSKYFVECVVESMREITSDYAKGDKGNSYLGAQLDAIGLNPLQRRYVLALIRLSFGEATHSLISGIEGQVTMGGQRHTCALYNRAGVELTGNLSDLLYEKLEVEDALDTSILSQPYYFDALEDS